MCVAGASQDPFHLHMHPSTNPPKVTRRLSVEEAAAGQWCSARACMFEHNACARKTKLCPSRAAMSWVRRATASAHGRYRRHPLHPIATRSKGECPPGRRARGHRGLPGAGRAGPAGRAPRTHTRARARARTHTRTAHPRSPTAGTTRRNTTRHATARRSSQRLCLCRCSELARSMARGGQSRARDALRHGLARCNLQKRARPRGRRANQRGPAALQLPLPPFPCSRGLQTPTGLFRQGTNRCCTVSSTR